VRPSAACEGEHEPSVTLANAKLGYATSVTTSSIAESKGGSYWMQVSYANWGMMHCR